MRKKIILTLLSIVGLANMAYAQDAKGTCKLPGTYDYVCVDFYKGPSQGAGSFKIINQGSVPILEVSVVITAEIHTNADEDGKVWSSNGFREVTLYNRTVYGIPAMDVKDVEVVMPRYDRIRNIKVQVGNTICKKTE